MTATEFLGDTAEPASAEAFLTGGQEPTSAEAFLGTAPAKHSPEELAAARQELQAATDKANSERGLLRAEAVAGEVGERVLYTLSQMNPAEIVRKLVNPSGQTLVTPEQAQEVLYPGIRQSGAGYVDPDTIEGGVTRFVTENVAGLTAPDALAAIALGKVSPQVPARYFQLGAIPAIPAAVDQVASAQSPGEVAKGVLNTALATYVPSVIGGHMRERGPRVAAEVKEQGAEGKGQTAEVSQQKTEGAAEPSGPVSEFGGLRELEAKQEAAERPNVGTEGAGEFADLVPAREVKTERAPSMLLGTLLRDAVWNHQEVPKQWVEEYNAQGGEPMAMPEGYRLTGEKWVYEEPAKPETSAQRMAREQREAMDALRKAKEESQVPGLESKAGETEARPTERAEPGTPTGAMGERPPDILDWVETSFPSGVKLKSKADYGDYVQEATGKARELLSLTKGEAADQVLKAMHEAGEYLRLQTPDDLAEAMLRAGEARKGWREQSKVSSLKSKVEEPAGEPLQASTDMPGVDDAAAADAIESWFNDAIEATKPGTEWMGRTSMGLAKVPVWLTQEAIHGALVVTKAAYVGGRDLARAVAAGVEHVRGLGLKGFDAGEAKAWLENTLGERETGQKVADSAVVSDPVKDAINEYLYERRTNVDDQATADAIVKRFGVDGALQAWREPGKMPGAVRSKLLGSITRSLAEQERAARAQGDFAAGERLAALQGKLWNEALPQITDAAQTLQAMRDLVDVSPDGQVARVRGELEGKAQQAIDGRRAEVEQVRQAVTEGQREGVQAVRQDPAVNGAARAAVDQAVQNSPETHRAVIMDLAEEWSQSSVIVAHARELVRARANQLLGRTPRPLGVSAGKHLQAILDGLGQRAATIAAGYFQGMATHPEGLVGLLKERLGLDKAQATKLAQTLERKFQEQVTAAKNKLPKRIASQRVAAQRRTGATLESTQAQTEAAIRRQLKELNTRLGDVLQQESGRQDQTGQHVAERIVQASGLTGEKADTLRNVLTNRWNALVTQAQVRKLEALQRAPGGTPVTKPMKDAFQKLVELNRLGALSSERFYDVVKKSLKLKQLTDADARQLRELVAKAQANPEGFMRERATTEVLQFTEKLTGNQQWWDVPLAIWYSNAVSGFTTYTKIPLENANMYLGNMVVALLSRPGELLHPLSFARATAGAVGRGLGKGALQAESTLRSGVITGVWEKPRGNILENKPFWEKADVLNLWKYLARITSTAHETTFKPAWEFKQAMMAREVARREGLRGAALEQRVADLMANTAESVAQAKAQALQELTALGRLKGRQAGESTAAFLKRQAADRLDLRRRTGEIIEQRREVTMPGSTAAAREYALRTAYLNEPWGIVGKLAAALSNALGEIRKDAPVTGFALKTQVPFVRVASNILNEALNWGPGGIVRAGESLKTGKLYGKEVLQGDRAEMLAKGLLGTAMLGALWTLAGDKIHGSGPPSPQKRKQLQASGWIPNSMEIGGKFYSYDKSVLKFWMATIGNYEDWKRYGKGDEADGVSRLAFVTKATANTLLNQSFLEGAKRVLEALGDQNSSTGGQKLEMALMRTGSTLVVPNMLAQLDRLWDPTIYDHSDVQSLLRSQIPFVRRGNRPALNVLGEPVESGPFHHWVSAVKPDPVWRTLAAQGAFVPEPSKGQIIGDKKRGPDYYRAMTPDEYYDFVAETGQAIRQRLERELDRLGTMRPDQAQARVQRIAEEEHDKAKRKLRL